MADMSLDQMLLLADVPHPRIAGRWKSWAWGKMG